MAAEADTGDGHAQAAKKPPIMLIAIIVAVVVLLGGGGAAFFLMSGAKSGTTAEGEGHAEAAGFVFNLPTMTVNLNATGGNASFMKLTIALEVADQSVMTEIQPQLAKVIDAFQVYMRELRLSDLEGSAGIYRLKEELLRRVNLAVFPQHVDAVLFKEILVQ